MRRVLRFTNCSVKSFQKLGDSTAAVLCNCTGEVGWDHFKSSVRLLLLFRACWTSRKAFWQCHWSFLSVLCVHLTIASHRGLQHVKIPVPTLLFFFFLTTSLMLLRCPLKPVHTAFSKALSKADICVPGATSLEPLVCKDSTVPATYGLVLAFQTIAVWFCAVACSLYIGWANWT